MRQIAKNGFTLIELMVVVAIVAILAGIAAPSFRDMIRNNRLATATNDLIGELALARSEAARQGKRITLCTSANASASSASCSAGATWQQGRIVFVDESDSGTAGTRDNGEAVLRANSTEATNITITASGFGTLNFIQFRPNGAISSGTTGNFLICDDRAGAFGRNIRIEPTGRVQLTSTTATCP